MTPKNGHRTITLTIVSQQRLAKLTGYFVFQFNGESFRFAPGATAFTAADCKTAFEGLRNIDSVACTTSAVTDFTVTYTIQLLKFPVIPYETNIFTNDGNPPLSAFSCSVEQVNKLRTNDALFCTVGEKDTDKTYPGTFLFIVAFCETVSKLLVFSCLLREPTSGLVLTPCLLYLCIEQNMPRAPIEGFATFPAAFASAFSSLKVPIVVSTKRP